jgi:hypothetical protein
LPTQEPCSCHGINGSITLHPDRMVIRHGGSTRLHEVPITQIRAVIIERKTLIPFATVTVLAVAAAFLVKYNPIWFLVNLPDKESTLVSIAALSVAIAFALPIILRSAFVNVSVRSEGDPILVRLGFVPVRPATRLAKRFRELSAGV